ncbi:MAG: hypothetical protein WCJ93_09540 [Methanomicrobiales archaeon]
MKSEVAEGHVQVNPHTVTYTSKGLCNTSGCQDINVPPTVTIEAVRAWALQRHVKEINAIRLIELNGGRITYDINEVNA